MIKRIVLLYSGGLDSFLLKKYANTYYKEAEIKCIYYKHGAESEEQEIKRLPGFVEVLSIDWLGRKRKPLPKKDDPFAGAIYIPGRNLVFSVLAACQELPDEIWMGTVFDEDNFKGTDKNKRFRVETSKLLSYVLSPFIGSVKIRFPFVEEKWTKNDCVYWALNNGVVKDEIIRTVSCWNQQDEKPCGVCKQCFKRHLVFLLNDIHQEHIKHPIKSNHGRKLLDMYIRIGLNKKVKKNRDEQNVFGMILKCYQKRLFDKEILGYIEENYEVS